MTTPGGPIGTAYVEIRPAPNARQEFARDLEQTVDPAARNVRDRIGKAVGDGLRSSSAQTGLAAGVGASLGTIVGQGLSAGLQRAYRGVTDVFRTGSAEVKDYQAGLAQLQAGIKSTGGVAGLTAGQMEKLASSIQAYSGQTDDSIVRSESFLLTFDKVRDGVGKGNDVFTRATKATADLAARLGGDASGKAILLGKALQDPQRGLVGLARAGVTFSDSQTKTIKALDASGRSLEAQKLILAGVEKQVGGSAEAYGKTLPGQIDRTRRAYEDLSQELLAHAAPALEAAATATRGAIDVASRLGPIVPVVAAVGGGLLIATKAVKAYREVRDVLFAGTAKTVAANEAVAASYDGIAASATRAAGAETAAGRAGGAGGVAPAAAAARGGLIATVGAATIGVVAAGIAVAVKEILDRRGLDKTIKEQVADALASGPDAARALAAKYGVRPNANGQPGSYVINPKADPDKTSAGVALLDSLLRAAGTVDTSRFIDPRLGPAGAALANARMQLASPDRRAQEASSLAGVFGSPFGELPDRTPGLASARETQRKADAALAAAQAAVARAGRSTGGASAGQIASAEASVVSAREAIRKRGGSDVAEQARLEAAEARLADLRGKGGVNTDRLRAAENRLAEARRAASSAAAATRKAEEGTALSVKAVLDRLGGQLRNAQGLRDDSKLLIRNGISKGVLEELDKLEQTAPGTLDKVAKSMTPALARQLNSQYAALQKVQQEFLTAPLRAAVEAAKAEQDKLLNDAAAQQAAAYQKALRSNAFGSLTGPAPAAPANRGGDPVAHGGGGSVVLQLDGYDATQVRRVAADVVARHDHLTAVLIGSQG